MSAVIAVRARSPRPLYREPGRTFTSSLVVTALIVLGFLLDLGIAGVRTHLIAWPIAFVVVVGGDLLSIRAARSLRSVTVTDTTLTVGAESIDRAAVCGVEPDVPAGTPVLGRSLAEGVPRGWRGLGLRLDDGGLLLVPTRRPDRLAAALATRPPPPKVRVAEPEDLPLLADIDAQAEALFAEAGVDLPDVGFPVDRLHDSKAVFVAGRPPVGFVCVDEVDGLAHVQELAVLPAYMRRGIGSALLTRACDWAREHDYPAITLITYADVPWNGPFYQARGFVEVSELTPEISELRDWESSVGLDRAGRRIVMRREL